MDDIAVYDWKGHLVEAWHHPGPVDLSSMYPPGPADVPEGETVVEVRFMELRGTEPFYVSKDDFDAITDPVSVAALRKEGEWPPGTK